MSDNSLLNLQALRLPKNPIVDANLPGLENEVGKNINGPSLIQVPDWIENSLSRFYLYFAHHAGKFIRLAYSNNFQDEWKVYTPGTLHLNQISKDICRNYIAAPDVHVDHQNRQIRMYFHGVHPRYGQVTFVTISKDGLRFTTIPHILGPFYFRVFHYEGWYYAIAKNKNIGGVVLRSKDGLTPFERGINFIPNMRHSAILLYKHTLIIYILFTDRGRS